MDRLKLTLDIRPNEVGIKEIDVRSNLVVANLLAEIQDKFNLDGTLELRPEADDAPLGLAEPLQQAGVQDGAKLICERVIEDTGTQDAIQRGVKEPFAGQFKRVYLQEEHSLAEYDLTWQPAIVGRRDHRNPSNNRLLAVDLEDIEDLPTVSRHHAAITLTDGKFFLERLAERNPTYLNEKPLKGGRKYPLPAGAKIQLGRVSLTFYIIS
jgi:hypothetical protein